jgi:hypothetical protein
MGTQTTPAGKQQVLRFAQDDKIEWNQARTTSDQRPFSYSVRLNSGTAAARVTAAKIER